MAAAQNASPAGDDDDMWGSFEAAFGGTAPPEKTTLPEADVAREVPSPHCAESLDVSSVMEQLETLSPQPPVEQVMPAIEPVALAPVPKPVLPMGSGLPVPVMSPREMVAQPIVAATTAAIRIEQRRSADLKVGHKGVLSLRLTTTQTSTQYELTVDSDLLAEPAVFHGASPTPGTYDVGSIRFLPKAAGDEEILLELTMLNAAGIPLARFTGRFNVPVASNENSSSIQAGGDVIVVGGRLPNLGSAVGASGLPSPIGDGWCEISVLEDQAFSKRISDQIPLASDDRPHDLAVEPGFAGGNGVLYAGTPDGSFVCYASSVGRSAAIGRGGATEACWWIRPVPDHSEQFSRISRKHLNLELRDGRAWLTDLSANGTSLNGKSLVQGAAVVLSDNDFVDLAGAMTFSVRVCGDGCSVTSVELRRQDGYADKLVLFLVQPGAPHRIEVAGQTAWLAWTTHGTVNLKTPAAPWQQADSGQESQLSGDFCAAWHVFDGPVDQDQLF